MTVHFYGEALIAVYLTRQNLGHKLEEGTENYKSLCKDLKVHTTLLVLETNEAMFFVNQSFSKVRDC